MKDLEREHILRALAEGGRFPQAGSRAPGISGTHKLQQYQGRGFSATSPASHWPVDCPVVICKLV